jgi:hypothetical protein
MAAAGLMMDFPLTLHHAFRRSERLHRSKRVVSFLDGNEKFSYTYGGNCRKKKKKKEKFIIHEQTMRASH